LAQLGVTRRPDVIAAPRGYFSAFGGQNISDITKDLGERWNFVDDMALKLIPGAHPFHVFAEAATAAVLENDIDLDAVASVIISGGQLTGVQMKDWIDIRHPRNLSDAAHSIVYFVAAAVADAKSGGFTWEHMDAVKMADPRIAKLQDLVEVDPNPLPLTNPRFVHLDGGRVSIVTRSAEAFTKHVEFPSGSARVPSVASVCGNTSTSTTKRFDAALEERRATVMASAAAVASSSSEEFASGSPVRSQTIVW